MNDDMANGYVKELFRSIQGEGIYVGVMQVFMRMAGCSLSCSYCDTPSGNGGQTDCMIFDGIDVKSIPNPVSPAKASEIAALMARCTTGLHSLSITGGEPLEQPDFLIGFLEIFRKEGVPVYLETNGLEEDAAREVLPLADIVSIDIKLPSLCGGGEYFDVYDRVLPVLAGKEFFCKIVVAESVDISEFTEAVELLTRHDRNARLVIQPASPVEGCEGASPGLLLDCYRKASARLGYVRVIPQCHRIIGLP